MTAKNDVLQLSEAVLALTVSQQAWVGSVIRQFALPKTFWRHETSDLITPEVLNSVGDALCIHHAFSRQALSKDRFEHVLERSLFANGFQVRLAASRTNRGHDLTVNGVPISLKTEASANIKVDSLHISKFMELGRGEWQLPLLLGLFLEHMQSYERILQLRCLKQAAEGYFYELVEIPKVLLQEARTAPLQVQEGSTQNPKPGYCRVVDQQGLEKFALYFDGGTERKLQIKGIRKSLCKVHATWAFDSAPL